MKYLLCHEQLDHIIRLLLTAVEDERETDRKTTDDLLVLGLPRVSQHLLRTGRVRRAEHDETQGVPSSLTSDSGVSEERLLEIVVRLCASAAHTRNTETQRRAVLDDLANRVAEHVAQVAFDLLTASATRIYETHGVQCTTLHVGVSSGSAVLGLSGEVGAEDVHTLLEMPLVDDTDRGGSGEFGPVVREDEPFQVLTQEHVGRGTCVHERVLQGESGVVDG